MQTDPAAESGPIPVETARKLYEAAGAAHDFDHVLRVLALAEKLVSAEGGDLAVVRTAALLHDIGEGTGRTDHHLRGAARARELLRDQPRAFVAAVSHAIETHRYRAGPEPQTLEAQIVSDADKLDAIGGVGIARVFAHAGARGTPLWRLPWRQILQVSDEDDPQNLYPAQRDPVGGAYTPGHEFVYKLSRIPQRLYTSTARAIAAERLAFMTAFFDRLDAEMGSLL